MVFKKTPNGNTASVTQNKQANKPVGLPLAQMTLDVMDNVPMVPASKELVLLLFTQHKFTQLSTLAM